MAAGPLLFAPALFVPAPPSAAQLVRLRRDRKEPAQTAFSEKMAEKSQKSPYHVDDL